MEDVMATTREHLQELLDALPEDRLADAIAAIEAIVNDDIPEDDEPFTDEDLAAIAETDVEYERGETISHASVRREIGW
jgi:hypothetical protein